MNHYVYITSPRIVGQSAPVAAVVEEEVALPVDCGYNAAPDWQLIVFAKAWSTSAGPFKAFRCASGHVAETAHISGG